MSESLDLEYLCINCVKIARDAGIQILDIYHNGFTVEKKDDNSPLTDADMASHNTIVNGLAKLTPDIPVLSEESDKPAFKERQQWHTYWLVDPLDGTREFIKRNGEFTVNIALIQHHKCILGVVHVPVSDVDYYAWKNGGAFKAKSGGAAKTIRVKKLDSEKLIVAGSRSHGTKQMQAYIKNLENFSGNNPQNNPGTLELLSMGSSLKLCLVAEGRADLYPRLGPTSEWDTAASHCIVEQAGGHLTKTDMTQLEYNTKDSLLNPFFFVFGDDSIDWSCFLESDLDN